MHNMNVFQTKSKQNAEAMQDKQGFFRESPLIFELHNKLAFFSEAFPA